MYHFDTYNVFLAIAKNIPQQLMTGFVVQRHICSIQRVLKCARRDFYANLMITVK